MDLQGSVVGCVWMCSLCLRFKFFKILANVYQHSIGIEQKKALPTSQKSFLYAGCPGIYKTFSTHLSPFGAGFSTSSFLDWLLRLHWASPSVCLDKRLF